MKKKYDGSTIVEFPDQTNLTRAETAKILRISVSALDSLITFEELPRIKYLRHVFFRRSDVEAYIDSHREVKSPVKDKEGGAA